MNKDDLLNKVKLNYNSDFYFGDKEKVYKKIKDSINNTMKYYLDLQDYIEELLIPKVDYFFLLINISMIYKALSVAKYKLDIWFDDTDSKVRIINNIPIVYELIDIYKKNYYRFNMREIFDEYFNDEQKLLESLVCIPNVIRFTDDAYTNTLLIKEMFDYIEFAFKFISEENEEYKKAD